MSDATETNGKRQLDAASSLVLLLATRDALEMLREALKELLVDESFAVRLDGRQNALVGKIRGCSKCAGSYVRDLLETVDWKGADK